MPRLSMVRKGEHYWLKRVETGEIIIGVCVGFQRGAGAVFHEIASGLRQGIDYYIPLAHIPYPVNVNPEEEQEIDWMDR